MEGGIGIALLIIAFVVIGGIAAFMYFTGGAVEMSADSESEQEPKQTHKQPTTPYHEHLQQQPERREGTG